MRRPLKIFLGLCLAIVMAGALTFCISESLVLRASRGQNYEDADYIIVLGAKVDPWVRRRRRQCHSRRQAR
ncbi:MAG: hypothetical protein IKN20_08730 [Firmicutes bacterium]|nr:hypothetical protein [Bacillota bacterium]